MAGNCCILTCGIFLLLKVDAGDRGRGCGRGIVVQVYMYVLPSHAVCPHFLKEQINAK